MGQLGTANHGHAAGGAAILAPMATRRRTRSRSNYATDPLLQGPDWEAIKAYWRRVRGPCARCGGAIDYDTMPRYWASLDVGHIVDRDQAKRAGWTRAEINSITNTQPEHQRCSREAGAILGNTPRRKKPTRIIPRPSEADEW